MFDMRFRGHRSFKDITYRLKETILFYLNIMLRK